MVKSHWREVGQDSDASLARLSLTTLPLERSGIHSDPFSASGFWLRTLTSGFRQLGRNTSVKLLTGKRRAVTTRRRAPPPGQGKYLAAGLHRSTGSDRNVPQQTNLVPAVLALIPLVHSNKCAARLRPPILNEPALRLAHIVKLDNVAGVEIDDTIRTFFKTLCQTKAGGAPS